VYSELGINTGRAGPMKKGGFRRFSGKRNLDGREKENLRDIVVRRELPMNTRCTDKTWRTLQPGGSTAVFKFQIISATAVLRNKFIAKILED
jgi:hypothetical protein